MGTTVWSGPAADPRTPGPKVNSFLYTQTLHGTYRGVVGGVNGAAVLWQSGSCMECLGHVRDVNLPLVGALRMFEVFTEDAISMPVRLRTFHHFHPCATCSCSLLKEHEVYTIIFETGVRSRTVSRR